MTVEQWQWLCDFEGPRGYVVRVNILPLFDPKYSIEIGMVVGGVIRRHLPGDMDPEEAQKIVELFFDALHHISELKARRFEERQKKQSEIDQKEREKRKRHDANIQARREENRKHAKGGSGKGASK